MAARGHAPCASSQLVQQFLSVFPNAGSGPEFELPQTQAQGFHKMVARALPCLLWLQQNYTGRCCGAHRSHAMGKERVLGEGGLAAVSSTQWGAAQNNRCLCSKNSWLCGCFPRRNPHLQCARGRQQHVGCQRSRTGTSWKAKETRQQIGNVSARGLKEQVVKLHILLKDTLGLETGHAGLAGQPASLQSQNTRPFPE